MSDHVRRIGYLHVSAPDQKSGVQTEALKQAGCDYIRQPVISKNPPAKEALRELLELLGGSDRLVVYRLDRLSRDEHTLTNFQEQLEALGVRLVVTTEQDAEGGSDAD